MEEFVKDILSRIIQKVMFTDEELIDFFEKNWKEPKAKFCRDFSVPYKIFQGWIYKKKKGDEKHLALQKSRFVPDVLRKWSILYKSSENQIIEVIKPKKLKEIFAEILSENLPKPNTIVFANKESHDNLRENFDENTYLICIVSPRENIQTLKAVRGAVTIPMTLKKDMEKTVLTISAAYLDMHLDKNIVFNFLMNDDGCSQEIIDNILDRKCYIAKREEKISSLLLVNLREKLNEVLLLKSNHIGKMFRLSNQEKTYFRAKNWSQILNSPGVLDFLGAKIVYGKNHTEYSLIKI